MASPDPSGVPSAGTPPHGTSSPSPDRPVVVQKFGGSSLATVDRIRAVARKIHETRAGGVDVVAVVSAMGDTTDELLDLASSVSSEPEPRELDMLLCAGERVSMSLVAMALRELGGESVSLTGAQAGMITSDRHNGAEIVEVRPDRIRQELAAGRTPVIAGYQGANAAGEFTTLGRGGSDTSAVALAAALGARHCDIFSDVDGVYSGDPRVIRSAKRIDSISYAEMQELSRHGARVLNAQAVEFARRKGISVFARSTFGPTTFTEVHGRDGDGSATDPRVVGVAGRNDVMTVEYAPERAGEDRTAELRRLLHEETDVLSSRVTPDTGRLQVICCTEDPGLPDRLESELREEFGDGATLGRDLATASIVGTGIGTSPETERAARRALLDADIELLGGFKRRDAVTCLVARDDAGAAVCRLHEAFLEVEPAAEPVGAPAGGDA